MLFRKTMTLCAATAACCLSAVATANAVYYVGPGAGIGDGTFHQTNNGYTQKDPNRISAPAGNYTLTMFWQGGYQRLPKYHAVPDISTQWNPTVPPQSPVIAQCGNNSGGYRANVSCYYNA